MPVKQQTTDLLSPAASGYAKFWQQLSDGLSSYTSEARESDEDASHAAEKQRCAADVVYWLATYGVTYDPRTKGKSLRFTPWPRQVEFLRWLSKLKDEAAEHFAGPSPVQVQGLCEKSRGVGVSFLCAADTLHDFLFVPGFKAGFGSRKFQYVDELGNLDSIFEKIRFMIRGLPTWMLPYGWKTGKHDTLGKFTNPENGASITGEAGDDIGRGGRCTVYYVDEAAHVEHPHLIDAALVENAGLRVDVSTPCGPGNPFAVKRFALPADKVFTFHWRDDPRKDEAWAEETRKVKGPTVFASEYDIDYSASIEGICIPGAWVQAAVGFDLGEDGVPYTCTEPEEWAGQDIAEEGSAESVFIPRHGPTVREPIAWRVANTTETAWRINDEALALITTNKKKPRVFYDVAGVGTGPKGVWKTSLRPLNFEPVAVNAGESPTETLWPDGQISKEKFFNLKAELWWILRRRFEKTYECWLYRKTLGKQGARHPSDEMISLPNCAQLIAQVSMPRYFRMESGKIKIESKDQLQQRGIKSPDYAEALVLSEAHYVKKRKEVWYR